MGRNRTCVLFACVTAACACSSKQAMSGGEAGEEAKAAESVPRWAIAAEDVVEAPEQDALLGLVTAVRTPARVRICTATPTGPRTVLTAAHCIAGDRAVFVADGREVGSSDVMRACQSGRCSEAPVEPAPGHESEFTRSDLAT